MTPFWFCHHNVLFCQHSQELSLDPQRTYWEMMAINPCTFLMLLASFQQHHLQHLRWKNIGPQHNDSICPPGREWSYKKQLLCVFTKGRVETDAFRQRLNIPSFRFSIRFILQCCPVSIRSATSRFHHLPGCSSLLFCSLPALDRMEITYGVEKSKKKKKLSRQNDYAFNLRSETNRICCRFRSFIPFSVLIIRAHCGHISAHSLLLLCVLSV